MMEKEFYIIDDGIRLHSKLDFPENYIEGGKCPLVIIVHGFTGNMEERHILGVRDTMNQCGYATLRVEMYGHGLSDGAFKDHTLFKWISNVMAVTDYAKTLDFVSDLYLCGHSQGGLLTILAGGMRSDDFKAILPLAPALLIPRGAREGSLLGAEFDPIHIPDEHTSGNWSISANYIRVAQMIYPEMEIKRYTGPVLLVHGNADQTVPVEDSIEAAKLYENCQLVIIEGDSHCFDFHLEEVLESIREFMTR